MTFDSVSEIPLQPSPGLPASPASVDAERLAERSTRGRWGRLRAALGQRQQLVPALSLHGIRELPFRRVQLGACYVIMEVTMGLLSALLGPGYLRGLFDKPCEPSAVQAMLTYLLWDDVPLSC
ncbi:unnamed protein product [Effrenium voratum]|nr:unnamed protein product [Effrenium voratum]